MGRNREEGVDRDEEEEEVMMKETKIWRRTLSGKKLRTGEVKGGNEDMEEREEEERRKQ